MATAQPQQKLFGYTVKDVSKLSGAPLADAHNIITAYQDKTLDDNEKLLFANFDIAKLDHFVETLKHHRPQALTSETFAGFNWQEIAAYLGVNKYQASGLIKASKNERPNFFERFQLSKIPKAAFTRDMGINWGLNHLAEHEKGSHYSGDFNVSKSIDIPKFFDRLFTVRPQSFTIGNIARAAGAVSSTIFTPALIAEVKVGGHNLWSTSQHSDALTNAAYTGADSFGQTRAGDPLKKESLLNKIFRVGGGAVGAIATGQAVGSAIEGVTTSAEVAETLEPIGVGSKLASTVSQTATIFSTGQLSQGIMALFGAKIGGSILALLSGDIKGAIDHLKASPSGYPTVGGQQIIYRNNPSASGGGGGGLGIGVGGNIGQFTSSTVLYGIAGIGLLLAVLLFLRRK